MFRAFRADTDQLQVIVRSFDQCAADTRSTLQDFLHALEVLRAGNWHSSGAERFYVEMDELILPQLGALTYFLETVGSQLAEAVNRFVAAEPGFKELERQIAVMATMREQMKKSVEHMTALSSSLDVSPRPVQPSSDDKE